MPIRIATREIVEINRRCIISLGGEKHHEKKKKLFFNCYYLVSVCVSLSISVRRLFLRLNIHSLVIFEAPSYMRKQKNEKDKPMTMETVSRRRGRAVGMN